jgi:S-formylglutathione hydrolase FrmB
VGRGENYVHVRLHAVNTALHLNPCSNEHAARILAPAGKHLWKAVQEVFRDLKPFMHKKTRLYGLRWLNRKLP